MPNLKDLRVRIDSVKSTQKITSAMKMVAAAKLRRAQDQAEAARPYSERMDQMLGSLSEGLPTGAGGPDLLVGNGKDDVHLIVVMSSDRGLCGGFNSSIVRGAVRIIRRLLDDGKEVKVLCVGRKGRDSIRRDYGSLIGETIEGIGRKAVVFEEADGIAARVREMFDAGEFDVCTLIYAKFKSAISNEIQAQQLIPAPIPEASDDADDLGGAVYEYEPSEEEILVDLLPRNISVQIYRALLENAASEHGARMAAMDNATRNAGERIKGLTLTYNRTRQAMITNELIEIISGAEAL